MSQLNAQKHGESADANEEASTLSHYAHVAYKRLWLIAAAFVVVVSAAALWTFMQPRLYRATATLLFSRRAPQVLGSKVGEVVDVSMGSLWRSKEYMKTQQKIITSFQLALQVVKRFHLAANKEFWGRDKRADTRIRDDESAARFLLGLTSAKPTRDATIMDVSVIHPLPKMAQLLADAVSETYIEENIAYRSSSTVHAVKWLSDQLDTLKGQVDEADRSLHLFKTENQIISDNIEDKQNLLVERMQKLNASLTTVRIDRLSLEANRNELRRLARGGFRTGPAFALVEVPSIASLRERYTAEKREYAALRARYGERHPLVRQRNATLKAAESALDDELKNAVASVDSRYRVVNAKETTLAAALEKAKSEALALNARELAYRKLRRTRDNTVKLYSDVLRRMKEATLSSQLKISSMRILDRAPLPDVPASPRVRLNLVLASFLGLMLGISLAFIADFLDTTIKSQEEIQYFPGVVFLGSVPRIAGATVSKSSQRPSPDANLDLVVHRDSKSSFAEACRAVRTNLLFTSPDRPLRSIVVTSPGPREGKTTTATNLGIAMAQSGERVLLVDTDMRRPRLHGVFGVSAKEGITSALLGDGKLEDLTKPTEVPNLFVLPCGPTPPNPAELCQSTRFKELLNEAVSAYDRVILDSPPVMAVTDAIVLATLVDAALLVGRTGRTSRDAMRETARQLQDVGGVDIGCVLNDVDQRRHGYGYHRRYGYYRYGYGDKEAAT